MLIKNILKDLPEEVRAYIYSFLSLSDVKEIRDQDVDNVFLWYVSSKVKENKERVFKNVILHKCFSCSNSLTENYLVNICSFCKFYIDKDETFPLYCTSCYHLENPRDFKFTTCKTCNKYSAVLGILPYS